MAVHCSYAQPLLQYLEEQPWTVVFHLCPNIPYLDGHSANALGNTIIDKFRDRLFEHSDRDSVMMYLIPELQSDGQRWHFHGAAAIKSKRRQREIIKIGGKWFEEITRKFVRDGLVRVAESWRCLRPDGAIVIRSDLIEPDGRVEPYRSSGEIVRYSAKTWQAGTPGEFLCLGSPAIDKSICKPDT